MMLCGINRCPRCGGHRLLRRSGREVLAVCAGCGLVTNEPNTAPEAGLMPPPTPALTPLVFPESTKSSDHTIDTVGPGAWR